MTQHTPRVNYLYEHKTRKDTTAIPYIVENGLVRFSTTDLKGRPTQAFCSFAHFNMTYELYRDEPILDDELFEL